MKTLKAILYSLLLPAVIFSYLLLLSRDRVDFSVAFRGTLLMYVVLVIGFLIFFIRNDAAIRYFWRIGWPEWITPGQIWLSVLGVACIIAASRIMWGIYMDTGKINYWLPLIAFAGAFLYRYAYTHNAPADLDAYEKERKYEEDPDALVTVAECNDSSSAHIIKGMLESNGIPVEIFGDGLSETLGVGKHSMPIRVLVRKRDKAAAEELINE